MELKTYTPVGPKFVFEKIKFKVLHYIKHDFNCERLGLSKDQTSMFICQHLGLSKDQTSMFKSFVINELH